MLNGGSVRASLRLYLPQQVVAEQKTVLVNETGCYRRPLKLMTNIFAKARVLDSIILFYYTTKSTGERTFCEPWKSTLYETYDDTVENGRLNFVDFYADGAGFLKSGT